MRDQVISDYESLEPEGKDTWNPITIDVQLGYRLALLYGLGRAFRASGCDLSKLNVVDIGCGNGRSTRSYLQFGLQPSQLCGLDFRTGAISVARQMHPSIRYDVQEDSRLPFKDQSVGWVSLCMVVSSIRASGDRKALAQEIQRVLKPGGFLFYIDHLYGSESVGWDRLDPDAIFSPQRLHWAKQLRLIDALIDADLSPWEAPRERPRLGWRFGRGQSLLSWIPRPDGLGAVVKARLPDDLKRWLSGEPKMFDIRLFGT
jgi:SAM-dependent methyltransferase